MTVPVADPHAAYLENQVELDQAALRVLRSGHYILATEVKRFEKDFADQMGAAAAVGTANGTAAISLALVAIGVSPGDDVLTVSHTAVATVAAIEAVGARPVLVDVDAERFTMDPASLRRTAESYPHARAVIPVHLYGQAADLESIQQVASEHNLKVVEDCAQAHGAELKGKTVGTWGEAAAFSFYPTKNLPSFGDAGAVIGPPDVIEAVASLRQYGWDRKRNSSRAGRNERMDELQAAFLNVNRKSLAKWNDRRRVIAATYSEQLAGYVQTPKTAESSKHVFHQYVIRTGNRDRLRRNLSEKGISTAIHYPVPVHLQTAYAGRVGLDPRGLPVTEALVGEIMSLPMYPQLPDDAVEAVIQAVQEHAESHTR